MCASLLLLGALVVAQTKAAETKSAPGAATTSVAMALDPATAATGQATVSADFNGDGILDLAFVNSTTGGVTVRLGKGDGTFAAGATPGAPASTVTVAATETSGSEEWLGNRLT
jgi:hypothetical protein